MYYGAAYYPEHRDPARWEFDLDNMAEAGVNCLRVAEFAWILMEPSEGEYDFEWLDNFKDLASKRGIKLLICPPLRTIPAWMVEKDPTVRIEDEEGRILEYGSRYSFCINHPYLIEKGGEIARVMAERYGNDSDIAGWHLDNEHGDEPDCHCPICTKKFQDWCREKYKTIDKLNEAWGFVFWGLNLQSFEQIPTTKLSKTFHSPGHDLDWRQFRSNSTVAAVAMQAKAVRSATSRDQYITSNNQTWNNRTNYYDMAEHLDITGTNYYPLYGEKSRQLSLGLSSVRCYKPNADGFQVHELRCGAHSIPGGVGLAPEPGEVERLTMHCIANGATGIFYFRWRACPVGCEQHHGTITGYDGERLDIYPEIAKLGNWLKANGDLLDKTAIRSDVGVLLDFPTRWVMETGVFWNGPGHLYMEQCNRVYWSVTELGYNCDTVNPKGDLSNYKVLIVPALAGLSDETAQKLCLFVENGGTLIWHPFSGIKDENARIYTGRLHPIMQEMLGVDINNYTTIDQGDTVSFSWNNKDYKAEMFCDLAKLPENSDTKVEASYTERFFTGKPALMKKSYGSGNVYYFTSFADGEFYTDFFKKIIPESGVDAWVPKNLNPRVEICTQVGDGVTLKFLINHSPETQTVEMNGDWDDIYNDRQGSGNIEIAPHGSVVLKF